MVKVHFRNPVGGGSIVDIVDKDTTIQQFLDDHDVDCSTGMTTIGSRPIFGAEFSQTFAQFGYSDEEGKNECWLSNVAKRDNA